MPWRAISNQSGQPVQPVVKERRAEGGTATGAGVMMEHHRVRKTGGAGAIRVVVVDDSGPMRQAIIDELCSFPGCQVVAQGENGRDGIHLARTLHPDVVVLDKEMPVIGGLEALRVLREEMPGVRVVLVTAGLDEAVRREALRLGAVACLEKATRLREGLQAAIKRHHG